LLLRLGQFAVLSGAAEWRITSVVSLWIKAEYYFQNYGELRITVTVFIISSAGKDSTPCPHMTASATP